MTPVDFAAIMAAVDKFKDLGVAGVVMTFCVFILIRDDRRNTAREEAMRKSFEQREEKFIVAMAENSKEFTGALRVILTDSTAAMKDLSVFVRDSLAEMRRKIDE